MKKYSNIYNGQAKRHSLRFLLTSLSLLLTLGAFAQTQGAAGETSPYWMFSNTLFNVLLGIIVFLLIVIAVLGGVLKGVGEVTLNNSKNGRGKVAGVIAFLFFSSVANTANAQTATAASDYGGLPPGLFFLMLTVIAFEVIAILVLVSSIKLLIRRDKEVAEALKEEPSLMEKWNASVAVENEADILMDHEYDGIRELDNDLPPWWKYGFYFSIVAAFAYLIHFHIFRTGDLQEAEYNKSVLAANIAKEEFAKLSASNVDENSVVMLTDMAAIAEGGSIFKGSCATCHGENGEGKAGPNLTDNYWLHGGSLKDVFSSIKYGWEDKGMISWKDQLSPVQIHQVACFIKTLKPVNPPAGKEPQGELFVEKVGAATDSTQTDSIHVMIDSAKVSL